MRHALLDVAGVVRNVIEWDGKSPVSIPRGTRLRQLAAGERCAKGFFERDGVLVDPSPPPPPPPTLDELAEAKADSMDRLWFEITFRLANEVRVLQARPEITRAQFRDYIIGVVKEMRQ